ncbi:MAG: hypothetical protein ABW173_07420 [Sphingomonas sp.]
MSLRYERYRWAGGDEWVAARGPAGGPRLLIVPPLFEEMNFTRATLTAFAIDLAARGIGTWLIDLPGAGESERDLEDVTLDEWRGAVAAAADMLGRPHLAAVRGGALVDDAADVASRWRFAATPGAALIRQMERAQAIGDREAGRAPPPADGRLRDLIGYRISPALVEAVRAAVPAEAGGPVRAAPFAGPGVPPWRRAEPAADPALAADMAADMAEWIASCGG